MAFARVITNSTPRNVFFNSPPSTPHTRRPLNSVGVTCLCGKKDRWTLDYIGIRLECRGDHPEERKQYDQGNNQENRVGDDFLDALFAAVTHPSFPPRTPPGFGVRKTVAASMSPPE